MPFWSCPRTAPRTSARSCARLKPRNAKPTYKVSTMNPRVFREYDIRGNADRDLDDGFVEDLGKAIGTHLQRAGARRITLGRDCRVHSPRIHQALRSGILSTGMEIIDVGVVATPLL